MAKHVESQDIRNRDRAGQGFMAEREAASSKYRLPAMGEQGMTDIKSGKAGEPFTKGTKEHLDV